MGAQSIPLDRTIPRLGPAGFKRFPRKKKEGEGGSGECKVQSAEWGKKLYALAPIVAMQSAAAKEFARRAPICEPSRILPLAEDDPALGQVIGRKLDLDLISGNDADEILSHLSRHVGHHFGPRFELHTEPRIGQRLGDGPFHFKGIFFLRHAPLAITRDVRQLDNAPVSSVGIPGRLERGCGGRWEAYELELCLQAWPLSASGSAACDKNHDANSDDDVG